MHKQNLILLVLSILGLIERYSLNFNHLSTLSLSLSLSLSLAIFNFERFGDPTDLACIVPSCQQQKQFF